MKIDTIHMMQIKPPDDRLHRHPFFELVYVLGGRATHYISRSG